MSFEAVLWATNDAPIANVNEFAVLTMLAEKADPDGCNAFPSRPTIAARTTVDPKTVLRALQAMEARGLIAQGDQRAADYIRADRRPVVYDLLIPYSWFPNIDRINKERQERGRRPLTRSIRPNIAPAPEKKQRSDKGKPRAKNQAADQYGTLRGDFESPRDSDGYGVSLSPARGDSQSATGGLQVTRTSPVTLPTTSNNSVLPSVCDVQVPDTPGSVMAGWTDGGGVVVGDEEQRPTAAGGVDTAADAAPESGSRRAEGASLGPVLVAWVEMTPGVQVLRAVAAEAPEWTITHAESLRDQGLVASGMLLEGFTPQEIRHALLSKPLPRPVRTTVAAVVGRRLRDLFAAGPAAGSGRSLCSSGLMATTRWLGRSPTAGTGPGCRRVGRSGARSWKVPCRAATSTGLVPGTETCVRTWRCPARTCARSAKAERSPGAPTAAGAAWLWLVCCAWRAPRSPRRPSRVTAPATAAIRADGQSRRLAFAAGARSRPRKPRSPPKLNGEPPAQRLAQRLKQPRLRIPPTRSPSDDMTDQIPPIMASRPCTPFGSEAR